MRLSRSHRLERVAQESGYVMLILRYAATKKKIYLAYYICGLRSVYNSTKSNCDVRSLLPQAELNLLPAVLCVTVLRAEIGWPETRGFQIRNATIRFKLVLEQAMCDQAPRRFQFC